MFYAATIKTATALLVLKAKVLDIHYLILPAADQQIWCDMSPHCYLIPLAFYHCLDAKLMMDSICPVY